MRRAEGRGKASSVGAEGGLYVRTTRDAQTMPHDVIRSGESASLTSMRRTGVEDGRRVEGRRELSRPTKSRPGSPSSQGAEK